MVEIKDKVYAIINSDDFNDLSLIGSWIKKVDKFYITGYLSILFIKNQTLFDIPESTMLYVKKIKETNKIVIPSDFVLLNENDDLIVNHNDEISQEISFNSSPIDIGNNSYSKYVEEINNNATHIIWYGDCVFNSEKITTKLKQLLITVIQNKQSKKYILDEGTYKDVLSIEKSHECYYVKNKKDFVNSLDFSKEFFIKIPNRTRRELNTEIINLELNDKTSIVRVPKKYLTKVKRESSRKRKRDEFANLKNKEGYVIEVSDLVKNYASGGNKITRVLNNLDLKIKKGEFIVLFGKSGSGKSTLLNIISGLDRPTSGNVVVMDNNLPYLSKIELTRFRRKYLSFIFQNYHLLNNITGYENVETGVYLKNKKESKEVIRDNIEKAFKEFDLYDVINKYPSQMSGGQQQRISILRALSKDADIIFADEPTGALDKKTSTIVLETLRRINKDLHKTVVMVSHDPSVVKYATRVVSLERGVIVSDEQTSNN